MSTPVLDSPRRYTKKPVTIEAMRYTGVDSASAIISWALENGVSVNYWCPNDETCRKGADGHVLRIPTLEGNMDAKLGDYIVRETDGEFSRYSPEDFDATYDEEDASLTQPEVLAHVVGTTLIQNAQLNG